MAEKTPEQIAEAKGLLDGAESLCVRVSAVPAGTKRHRWTLREDNHAHHHGRVHLAESPFYLDLSWRPDAAGPIEHVGLFRLDLHGLLRGGFIRYDPVGSKGSEVRLRVVHAGDGLFYGQARATGTRIQLPLGR